MTITGWKSNSLLSKASASLHDVIDALTDVAVAIYLSKGEGLGCYIGFFQEWTVDTGELLRLPDCQLSALRDVIDVNTDMAVAIQTGCNWCKL